MADTTVETTALYQGPALLLWRDAVPRVLANGSTDFT